MDGFRPDALDPTRTPILLGLAARGASTFSAQTILPSATLPAHASMLTGYDVEDHGVTWNDYIPANGFARTTTIFGLAHDAGYRTVMVVAKEKLVQIALPGTVDEFIYQPVGDFAIAEIAATVRGFGVLCPPLARPAATLRVMSASYWDGTTPTPPSAECWMRWAGRAERDDSSSSPPITGWQDRPLLLSRTPVGGSLPPWRHRSRAPPAVRSSRHAAMAAELDCPPSMDGSGDDAFGL
jgi:hypothetical protein